MKCLILAVVVTVSVCTSFAQVWEPLEVDTVLTVLMPGEIEYKTTGPGKMMWGAVLPTGRLVVGKYADPMLNDFAAVLSDNMTYMLIRSAMKGMASSGENKIIDSVFVRTNGLLQLHATVHMRLDTVDYDPLFTKP